MITKPAVWVLSTTITAQQLSNSRAQAHLLPTPISGFNAGYWSMIRVRWYQLHLCVTNDMELPAGVGGSNRWWRSRTVISGSTIWAGHKGRGGRFSTVTFNSDNATCFYSYHPLHIHTHTHTHLTDHTPNTTICPHHLPRPENNWFGLVIRNWKEDGGKLHQEWRRRIGGQGKSRKLEQERSSSLHLRSCLFFSQWGIFCTN